MFINHMTTVLHSLSLHTLSCHLIAARFPAPLLNHWQPPLPPKPRMQWWCMHGQLSHVSVLDLTLGAVLVHTLG
jgi:hypothetical protein